MTDNAFKDWTKSSTPAPGNLGGSVGFWSFSGATELSASEDFFSLLGEPHAATLKLEYFVDLIHTDDRSTTRSSFERITQAPGVLEVEFRLAEPSREGRWFTMRGAPYLDSDDEGTLHIRGMLFETTSQRQEITLLRQQLEQEIKRRETAEAADRGKEEFVALVSHELRAPLNAMLGWARILQTKQVDPETLKRAVDTIERSARAQSKLIEDLIDSVRISTGKLRLESHRVDLNRVVTTAVDSVRPSAEAKEISIKVRMPDTTLEVAGDADRLRQAVGNLLSNAVKFTPSGGVIDVLLEQIEQDARVTVKDSGIGISSELLPRVFDRFDQAGHANTRRHGGLGLGLSLVRQLVDLHGGSVRAESAGEGKGATFTIQLRLNRSWAAPGRTPAPGTTGELTAPSASLLSGTSILVVDDDSDARELTSMLLRKNGAIVRVAASAAEAFTVLSASADFEPDLLLSDIGMPDEDGYSLIARVRALTRQNVASIPAIALTAFSSAEDRERAFASGFDAHLTKPIEPNQLIGEILRLTPRVGATRS